MEPSAKSPRILVIRRDNIGDLVCTTPLIRSLREQLPGAYIAALVTRYNMAVLARNPDIDALFSYTKAKHLEPGESAITSSGIASSRSGSCGASASTGSCFREGRRGAPFVLPT